MGLSGTTPFGMLFIREARSLTGLVRGRSGDAQRPRIGFPVGRLPVPGGKGAHVLANSRQFLTRPRTGRMVAVDPPGR